MKQIHSLKHKALIAVPEFGRSADIFSTSLVYICEHSECGALGLVINKTVNFKLPELLRRAGLGRKGKDVAKSLDRFVLSGGPVCTEQGFVLHTDDCHPAGSKALGNGLSWSSSRTVLEQIAMLNGPEKFTVSMGFAGWAPNQLDAEMKRNYWLTIPAEMDVLFDLPVSQRLPKTMQRIGFDYNLIAPSGRA